MSEEFYPVLSVRSLLDMPPPPMLIDNMIMMRGVTGLSSDPGIGKTFLTIEMARAVVTGGKFLGRFPAKPGAVCFVGQDASVLEYAQQLRKVIQKEYTEQERKLSSFEDKVVGTDFDDKLRFMIQPGLSLESGADVAKLANTVNRIQHYENTNDPDMPFITPTGDVVMTQNEPTKNGVNLLILDTLASMHKADENDNMQMQVVFQNLRYLAEATKAAVVITHHHPASDPRWRGATSQLGALDGHIMLEREKGGLVGLSLPKFRGIRINPFQYTMHADETSVTFDVHLSTEPSSDDTLVDEIAGIVLTMRGTHVNQNVNVIDLTRAVQGCRPFMNTKQAKALLTSDDGVLDQLIERGVLTRVEPNKWRIEDVQDNPQAPGQPEEPGDGGEAGEEDQKTEANRE